MCGIVGYVGMVPCKSTILSGLKCLEYRGYDSAGFGCVDHAGELRYVKAVGHVASLEQKLEALPLDGVCGIGHTRWATHGCATEENTHPHFNCDKTVAVVHNGIIENFADLKDELVKDNHSFLSVTDSECLAHIFSHHLKQECTAREALQKCARTLQGSCAAVFLTQKYPQSLFLIRKQSPLCIGIGQNEVFVASDQLALSDRAHKIVFMPEQSVAVITHNHIEIFDFQSNKPLGWQPQKNILCVSGVSQEGYESFMLKEIYEQRGAIQKTLLHYENYSFQNMWQDLGLSVEDITTCTSFHLVAAGTSWHAARITQFFLEMIVRVPVRVHVASEFRYMPFFPDKKAIYIFVTQSGETADTLEALRMVKRAKLTTVALTNVASSSVVREAGGALITHAGPERAVCSTKAFSCQVASFYWLAHQIAFVRGIVDENKKKMCHEVLNQAGRVLEESLDFYAPVIMQRDALQYSQYDRFIFLGRQISYPFALEAALKLKEISYSFAQCYPAGELKHGPLALVDEKNPVVLFSVLDPVVYQKLVSNAQEVKARNGHLLVFAFEGQDELINLAQTSYVIPRVEPLLGPLAMTGVMQFFAYAITKKLGNPIDKPRNLAKSVTVE